MKFKSRPRIFASVPLMGARPTPWPSPVPAYVPDPDPAVEAARLAKRLDWRSDPKPSPGEWDAWRGLKRLPLGVALAALKAELKNFNGGWNPHRWDLRLEEEVRALKRPNAVAQTPPESTPTNPKP